MAKFDLVVGLGERLYRVERPWGVLPDGMRLNGVSDVAIDSRDRVFVCQRGDPPVVAFDSSGRYLGDWGIGVIADAHGMYISPDDRLLLADRDGHQIMTFDLDGNLLSTIGNRQRPGFQRPFNHPTDVASGPNGDLYVADGYGNSTVHVFSPDGEWKQSWGRPGKGPGEFTTPHAIRVHRDGRVLVVDRENGRIQVFSPGGEYLSAWDDLAGPMDLYAAPDGMVFVTDHVPRLSMFGPDGTLLGRCKGPFYGAHGVWGDSQGNLFQAEMEPMNCLVKLTRIE